MTFFAKLWTDIIGDPKLMRAHRNGAKQLVVLPWLIVFAKKVDDEGRLTVGGTPAEPEDIAEGMPVTVKQVRDAMFALRDMGVLIDDEESGALRFASWEKRSGYVKKPSDAPGRVKTRVEKHRAKKKAEAAPPEESPYRPETPIETPDETPAETPVKRVTDGDGNAPETPRARARSRDEEEEKDLDRDEDGEGDKPTAPSSASVRSSADAKVDALLAAWDFGPWRATVERFLRGLPTPTAIYAVAADFELFLQGELGYERCDPVTLGVAVHEYVASGETKYSARYFSAFVRRARGAKAARHADVAIAKVRTQDATDDAETAAVEARVHRFADDSPDRYAELVAEAQAHATRELPAGTPQGGFFWEMLVKAEVKRLVLRELDGGAEAAA